MNTSIQQVVNWYRQGEVFAYPTEAVFGLGCDPQNEPAVKMILSIKSRPIEKGMILIASEFAQIAPYVEFSSLPKTSQTKILASWPGPVTWLLPKSSFTPIWISGDSNMVAVRISAHPIVRNICDLLKQAIVSTSANPAGKEPAKSVQDIIKYFGDSLHYIDGELGQQQSPSKIFHSLTMETIRA